MLDFIIPHTLAIFAVDDAIYAALISAAIGTAAQAATSQDTESRSSSPMNNIPKLDQPEDPWSWFRQMMNK